MGLWSRVCGLLLILQFGAHNLIHGLNSDTCSRVGILAFSGSPENNSPVTCENQGFGDATAKDGNDQGWVQVALTEAFRLPPCFQPCLSLTPALQATCASALKLSEF